MPTYPWAVSTFARANRSRLVSIYRRKFTRRFPHGSFARSPAGRGCSLRGEICMQRAILETKRRSQN